MGAAVPVVLMQLVAERDVAVAGRRGGRSLLGQVVDLLRTTPPSEIERRAELHNAYAELVREGPALTIEQAARLAALIAGGDR